VKKKTSNVPVYLIYAGIIHVVGLALLLPMLITLPGPSREVTSQSSAIDVEIVADSPAQAKIETDSEQTAALPAAPGSEDAADKPDAGDDVANVSPDAAPQDATESTAPQEPSAAEAPPEEKSPTAKSAKVAPRASKKPVAQHSRTARPVVRRAAKSQTKITPFNGALSGLFSPGAPANNRHR